MGENLEGQVKRKSRNILKFNLASVSKASVETQLPPFHTHIFLFFGHFSLKFALRIFFFFDKLY